MLTRCHLAQDKQTRHAGKQADRRTRHRLPSLLGRTQKKSTEAFSPPPPRPRDIPRKRTRARKIHIHRHTTHTQAQAQTLSATNWVTQPALNSHESPTNPPTHSLTGSPTHFSCSSLTPIHFAPHPPPPGAKTRCSGFPRQQRGGIRSRGNPVTVPSQHAKVILAQEHQQPVLGLHIDLRKRLGNRRRRDRILTPHLMLLLLF